MPVPAYPRAELRGERSEHLRVLQMLRGDGEHVVFWRNRYVENQKAWKWAVASGCKRDFRVAKARADQSAAILQRLQEPIPTLEIDHAATA